MTSTHTPGAIRAAQRIHAILKRHLPFLADSNVDTLIAIIDKETAAPELLEAVLLYLSTYADTQTNPTPTQESACIIAARLAVEKNETGRE